MYRSNPPSSPSNVYRDAAMRAGYAQDSAPLPPKPKRLRVRVEPAKPTPTPVPKVATGKAKPASKFRKPSSKSARAGMSMVLNDDEAALLREYRDIESIAQARTGPEER